jgi:hypothetical protein
LYCTLDQYSSLMNPPKVGTRMYPGQVVEVQDVGALSVYSRQVVEGADAPVYSEPIFQIFR